MDNSFWKNAYGQVRAVWQGIGTAVLAAVASYILTTSNVDWTLRGAGVAAVVGAATFIVTRSDHKKTDREVKTAAVTHEVPGKEES